MERKDTANGINLEDETTAKELAKLALAELKPNTVTVSFCLLKAASLMRRSPNY